MTVCCKLIFNSYINNLLLYFFFYVFIFSLFFFFFFSSRRRHTRWNCDWSSDVCSSDLALFCGVLLLPRYFQFARDVSATHSGLLIYPLLLGLVVSVNVGAAIVVRRLDFRGPILAGMALAALGALGFATFDAGTPDALSLLFMAWLGVGVGPALSGLQIALQRTVAPPLIGAAMGTLLLLRQLGGAVALAAAETIYAARLHDALAAGDAPRQAAATATGTGV